MWTKKMMLSLLLVWITQATTVEKDTPELSPNDLEELGAADDDDEPEEDQELKEIRDRLGLEANDEGQEQELTTELDTSISCFTGYKQCTKPEMSQYCVISHNDLEECSDQIEHPNVDNPYIMPYFGARYSVGLYTSDGVLEAEDVDYSQPSAEDNNNTPELGEKGAGRRRLFVVGTAKKGLDAISSEENVNNLANIVKYVPVIILAIIFVVAGGIIVYTKRYYSGSTMTVTTRSLILSPEEQQRIDAEEAKKDAMVQELQSDLATKVANEEKLKALRKLAGDAFPAPQYGGFGGNAQFQTNYGPIEGWSRGPYNNDEDMEDEEWMHEAFSVKRVVHEDDEVPSVKRVVHEDDEDMKDAPRVQRMVHEDDERLP